VSEKKCSLRADDVFGWVSSSTWKGRVNRRYEELLNPSRGGEFEETMREDESVDQRSPRDRTGRVSWIRLGQWMRTLLSEGRLYLQSRELEAN
jgi:hypothetical protein